MNGNIKKTIEYIQHQYLNPYTNRQTNMAVQLNIPSIFNELEVLRIPQNRNDLTQLQNDVRDLLADHNMEIVAPNTVYNKLPHLDFEQFDEILMNNSFFRASVLFRFHSNLEYRVNNFERNPYVVHGFTPEETVIFHKYQYWMRYLIVCGRQNDFWTAFHEVREIFTTSVQQYRFRMCCHPDFNSMNIFEMAVLWINDEDFIVRLTDHDFVPDYEFLDRCRNNGFSQRIYHNPFYLLFIPLNCGNGPFFTTQHGRIMLRNYNILPGMLRDWDEFLNEYYNVMDNDTEYIDTREDDTGENDTRENDIGENEDDSNEHDESYIDNAYMDNIEQNIREDLIEQINNTQNYEQNSNQNNEGEYYSDSTTEDEPDSCG